MPEKTFYPLSDQKKPPTYHYFDGTAWRMSKSNKTSEVRSPVDGSVVAILRSNTKEEIDAVILRAHEAQGAWEATPLNKRVKVMHLSADWIRHFEHYLATFLVWEIGKDYESAKSEVKRTADLIDYYADEVLTLRGETLDSDNFPGYDKGRIAIVERVAYGVVLAIAPFNYPINLAASKIAPALLMGNCVVFKPPTYGSVSGIHLTQIFIKAGVPEGVLSCVTGGGSDIGDYIVSHPGIDVITFTGSSDTGDRIASKARMVPLIFECGGNNPAVILPDSDIILAAEEIVKGAFSYSGQRCTAIKYVLSTKSVLEKLIPAVKKATKELVKMGDPRNPSTKLVGPVITEGDALRIEEEILKAVKEGAKIVTGGKRNKAYIEPTILKNATSNMGVVAKEVFGPIVSFIEIKSIDQAIDCVNKSAYGLQASIFTRDEGRGIVLAKKLNVGTVQINGSPQRGPDHFPFLGVKKSGLGVQGVRYSLEEMSRLRPIVLNKPE